MSSDGSGVSEKGQILPGGVRELLVVIQHELFNRGGELSIPGYALLKMDAVLRLDQALAAALREDSLA